MSEKKIVLGVWCGASPAELLAPVGLPGDRQIPLLRITLARARSTEIFAALIPWTPLYDPLAADVKEWGYPLRRTHPDERVAMRDFVAQHDAGSGVIVYGPAAVIDRAEIAMATARLQLGIGDRAYGNARMRCLPAEVWLLINDEGEWLEPMSPRDLSLLYATERERDGIPRSEARMLRARRDSRWRDQTPRV